MVALGMTLVIITGGIDLAVGSTVAGVGTVLMAMIDTGAFEGCNGLRRVELPDSLLIIGKMAFYYCTELTDVVLPPHLYAIGPSAFVDCWKLTAISVNLS